MNVRDTDILPLMLIRTAGLPLQLPGGPDEEFTASHYAAQLLAEKRTLREYATYESLSRALLFSSHSLLRELPKFAASDPEHWNKKHRRMAAALLKYRYRAATKTTPFSRFATVSLHHSERENSVDVFSADKPVATPNVAMLPLFYEVLLQEPAFYHSLKIRLNPSLQTAEGGQEWLYYNGEQESFQHAAMNTLLKRVQACFSDPHTLLPFSGLVAGLSEKVESETPAAQSAVFQLIDYGYLEWVFPERGLSPGWCGSMYNYLGFLPSAPVITDAAFLLQWLRTAARTLTFQNIPAAMEMQQEAVSQCRAFFERYDLAFPDIPPEQIFYEDVATPIQSNIPETAIKTVLHDLGHALKNAVPYQVSGLRAQILHFGKQLLNPGDSVSFLSFCKLFLENKDPETPVEILENQLDIEKIGALLQFYKTENGDYRAVLNALYPGGGKMMARWLHLFPAIAAEQLKSWWPEGTCAFPWQHWSNANFQPQLAQQEVWVPGGRTGEFKNGTSLNDLLVFREGDALYLTDRKSGNRIVFTDAGLQAHSTLPPVIRILWHLGVPYISTAVLEDAASLMCLEKGVILQKRMEYQSIVWSRQTWFVSPEVWLKTFPEPKITDSKAFVFLRKALSGWGVPRCFFAGFHNEPARFFDQNSPMLLQEFKKMIEKDVKEIVISEMLPASEQWVAEVAGALHAAEWAVEWKLAGNPA